MTPKTSLIVAACLVASVSLVIACGSSDDGSNFEEGSSGNSPGGGNASGSGGFGGSNGGGNTTGADAGVDECKKMDIAFVVDNSGSMSQEQNNLAANFPKFIDVINAYKTKSGEQLDYRIAVTSSDMTNKGLRGELTNQRGAGASSSCSPGPDRRWLVRADNTVADFFSCRAQLGDDGDGIERPLEALLNGLTARIADGTNKSGGEGFVRKDALLALVVLTDEDEGGSENKQPMATAELLAGFEKVAGGKGRWAAAAIAGPGPKDCSSPGLGSAKPAVRVKQFIDGLGKNGVFSSICAGDLTEGLQQALKTFDAACKDFPSGNVN